MLIPRLRMVVMGTDIRRLDTAAGNYRRMLWFVSCLWYTTIYCAKLAARESTALHSAPWLSPCCQCNRQLRHARFTNTRESWQVVMIDTLRCVCSGCVMGACTTIPLRYSTMEFISQHYSCRSDSMTAEHTASCYYHVGETQQTECCFLRNLFTQINFRIHSVTKK